MEPVQWAEPPEGTITKICYNCQNTNIDEIEWWPTDGAYACKNNLRCYERVIGAYNKFQANLKDKQSITLSFEQWLTIHAKDIDYAATADGPIEDYIDKDIRAKIVDLIKMVWNRE